MTTETQGRSGDRATARTLRLPPELSNQLWLLIADHLSREQESPDAPLTALTTDMRTVAVDALNALDVFHGISLTPTEKDGLLRRLPPEWRTDPRGAASLRKARALRTAAAEGAIDLGVDRRRFEDRLRGGRWAAGASSSAISLSLAVRPSAQLAAVEEDTRAGRPPREPSPKGLLPRTPSPRTRTVPSRP